MFEKSAAFYDALYSWKDYEGEVAKLRELIQRHSPRATALLDVACGTGRHLELLRRDYEVEGLDLDANLLEIARERNPGCTFYADDMVDFDLGRTYDVVICLFSSIGYVQTKEKLARATRTMAKHLSPGGVMAIEPWLTPAVFDEGHIGLLVVDEPELKITRMNSTRRSGDLSIIDFDYLVGSSGEVEHFTETHSLGLFTDEEHLDAMRRCGLEPQEGADLMGRGLHVATKPS